MGLFIAEKQVLVAVTNAARRALPTSSSRTPRQDPLGKLSLEMAWAAPLARALGAVACMAVQVEAVGHAGLSG